MEIYSHVLQGNHMMPEGKRQDARNSCTSHNLHSSKQKKKEVKPLLMRKYLSSQKTLSFSG